MGIIKDIRTGTFVTVFHRILDFKTGLDLYPGPFLFNQQLLHFIDISSIYFNRIDALGKTN